MTGLLLALLSAAAWGTSDLLGGQRTTRQPATSVLVVAYAAGTSALALVVLAVGALPGSGAAAVAVVAGFVELGGIAALYRGLAAAPARLVAPLAALAPVVAGAGGLLVGDVPGPLAAAALLPVLAGLVLVARGERDGAARPGAGVARTALVHGLLAALGFGGGYLALDRAVARLAEPGVGDVLGVLLVARLAALVLLLAGAATGRVRLPGRDQALPLAGIGLLAVVGGAGYTGAAALVPVGVAAAVASCHTVVTVLLASVLLGQPVAWLQRAGVVLCVLGVAGVAAAP